MINKESDYYKYARGVLDGNILASRAIKNACKRFFIFIDRDDLYFDEKAVNKVIKFFSIIKHYLGKHSGKPFILLDWQKFMVACIYGFKYKSSSLRVCRNAFILMARKNGKSAFCAGLALYHLLADNEMAGQIFFAANSREQAKILLQITSQFTKSIDPKGNTLDVFRDTIKFKKDNGSFIKVVSADTSKLDGYNLSFAVIDEEHEAKDSKMIDIISSSMGMRTQPLLIEISTAGFNQFGICKEKYNVAKEVLEGLKEDDSLWAFIFELDPDDNWEDPKVWKKANPCLGETVSEDYLKTEINKAKNTPSLQVSVRTKNLNQWLSSNDVWINSDIINTSCKDLKDEFFYSKDIYMGVDLAAVSDLTALSYLFYDAEADLYYFKNKYYLPEESLYNNSNSDKYQNWKRLGYLTITQGNVTDYDYVTNDIMKLYNNSQIRGIAYDSWNSTQWAIKCTELNLPLRPFSQSIGNFNKPTKELERLLLSRKVVIDNNPITRFCFENVSLKYDFNDNCKPVKAIAQNKIDGVIAIIESLGIYLSEPHYSNELLTI